MKSWVIMGLTALAAVVAGVLLTVGVAQELAVVLLILCLIGVATARMGVGASPTEDAAGHD